MAVALQSGTDGQRAAHLRPVPQALVRHIDNRTLTEHDAHWLLRDVTALAHRLPAAHPRAFAGRLALAEALVTATRPHLRAPSLPPLLFAAVHAVLYAHGPAHSAAVAGASQALIARAVGAVWGAGPGACGPAPALAIGGVLPVRVSHVLRGASLPAVGAGSVTVHFPAGLGPALAARAPGGVDVAVVEAPPAAGMLVPLATVTVSDSDTGTEVAVQQLVEPVSLIWPVDGSALLQPLQHFYRCVYEVRLECVRGGVLARRPRPGLLLHVPLYNSAQAQVWWAHQVGAVKCTRYLSVVFDIVYVGFVTLGRALRNTISGYFCVTAKGFYGNEGRGRDGRGRGLKPGFKRGCQSGNWWSEMWLGPKAGFTTRLVSYWGWAEVVNVEGSVMPRGVGWGNPPPPPLSSAVPQGLSATLTERAGCRKSVHRDYGGGGYGSKTGMGNLVFQMGRQIYHRKRRGSPRNFPHTPAGAVVGSQSVHHITSASLWVTSWSLSGLFGC